MKRLLTALVLGSGVLAASAVAATADPIANRQNIMKNVGAATGVLGKMAKGEMEFDALQAQLALRVLNAASYGFGELFPEGSESGGDTEAKDTIWSDRDGFNKVLASFQETTGAAVAAPPGSQGDVGAALGAIGKTCGTCHEGYRIKK